MENLSKGWNYNYFTTEIKGINNAWKKWKKYK